MSAKLKVAVLGVGSLGKEHARLYADLAAAGLIDFAGIYDVSAPQAAKIAAKLRVPQFASLEDAIAGAEAFSVVTPTTTHFDLASRLIAAGKHVLVEKPMTSMAPSSSGPKLAPVRLEPNALGGVGGMKLILASFMSVRTENLGSYWYVTRF